MSIRVLLSNKIHRHQLTHSSLLSTRLTHVILQKLPEEQPKIESLSELIFTISNFPISSNYFCFIIFVQF